MWPFLVAAGMSMMGSALKGLSAIGAGAAQKRAENTTADRAEQAAADALHRSAIAEFRASAKGAAVVAEQRVEGSGGGIDVNTGSNTDLALQTAGFAELDKEIIRNDAMREAYGLRLEAQFHRQRGEYLEEAGRQEAMGDFIGGIGRVAGIIGPPSSDIGGSSPGIGRGA